MQRTRSRRKRPADAILTADLHLTDTTPVSRMDDYVQAQKDKLRFLRRLSRDNDRCPILCAGDLFDKWRGGGPGFLGQVFLDLPRPFITIAGNHDLPMHSLDRYESSALCLMSLVSPPGTFLVPGLEEDPILEYDVGTSTFLIVGRAYGDTSPLPPIPSKDPVRGRNILLLHEMIWPDKVPFWDQGGRNVDDVIDEYGDQFDLIVVGDNHQSFIHREDNVLVVNPGSMLRRTADQIDFQPQCYLYYADENAVVPTPFPIQKGVISRDHIDRKKDRENRTAAYIERMQSGWEGGVSYRENLESFFKAQKTPRKVREIIWQHFPDQKI